MKHLLLMILILAGMSHLRRIQQVNQFKADHAVFASIYQGDVKAVRDYLDHGGSPDARMPLPQKKTISGLTICDATEISLLHAAIGQNAPEIVKMLLDRGANPNCYSLGTTPLFCNRMEMDGLIYPGSSSFPGAPANAAKRTTALQNRLEIGRLLIARGGVADHFPYRRRDWAKDFHETITASPAPPLFLLHYQDRIDFYRDGLVRQVAIPADIGDYRVGRAFEAAQEEWLKTQQTNGPLHVVILAAADATNQLWRLRQWGKTNHVTVSDEYIPAYVHCDPLAVVQLFTDPQEPLLPQADGWKDFCAGATNEYSEDQTEWRDFFSSDLASILARYEADRIAGEAKMKEREAQMKAAPNHP